MYFYFRLSLNKLEQTSNIDLATIKTMSKSSNKKDVVSDQVREKEQLKQMKKHDVTYLKEQIHSYRDQLKHLITEKSSIEKYIETKHAEYMEQSYELQKIAKVQEEELIDLQDKLKILKNSFDEAQNKRNIQYREELDNLQQKKNIQKETIKKVYENLHKKVTYLKNFKEREVQYLQTLDSLEEKRQMMRQGHTKDLEKIKNTNQNKRTQIKEITNQEIQNIQENEVHKIKEKLTKEQQIKKQNVLMQAQINLCMEQKEIVQRECELLSQQLRSGSKDSGHILGGQATETYQRSLRVIKLEGKINKLKEYMNEEIQRLDTSLILMEKQYNEAEKTTAEKAQKLRNMINVKQRDLKKIKASSQMVLNQRSSLESYLLEVFYENTQVNSRDPSCVNEILKKLFVKINSKKTPINYRHYLNSIKKEDGMLGSGLSQSGATRNA